MLAETSRCGGLHVQMVLAYPKGKAVATAVAMVLMSASLPAQAVTCSRITQATELSAIAEAVAVAIVVEQVPALTTTVSLTLRSLVCDDGAGDDVRGGIQNAGAVGGVHVDSACILQASNNTDVDGGNASAAPVLRICLGHDQGLHTSVTSSALGHS